MRKGFLSTLFVLLAAAELAVAQSPIPSTGSATVNGQGAQLDQPAAMPIVTMPSGSVNEMPSPCCDQPCHIGPEVCGPPGRVWVSAEYLLWWFKNDHIPPI